MTPEDEASTDSEDSALEETAREQLGVERWDRPLIFRETAEASTDTSLPYWSILLLSGAIATLGLALNNAAVVIGAMLIAPLLAPTMGLALALAVGDARLASQAGLAVAISTAAVIATAMLLTLVLPFQTFTAEITARTRPTTLDLAIAVFSGLAGAVVSVTRRKGLSAAIPGVAVAVALIPPLAVAGFSAGAGFRWSFIKGSMLLYGANLAGIVFSGTVVFLLIGMHRPTVVEAAREWHRKAAPTRLSKWAARTRWMPSPGPIRSPMVRIGLVLAFVAVLAIPLTITLTEIARETRIQRAINRASKIFEVQGRSSILSLQPVIGDNKSQALLRVATTEWFGDEARENFERAASARAGEPIRLILEQLPTSSGDLEQLAGLFPQDRPATASRPPPDLNTLLAPARERIQEAIAGLSVPASITIVGSEMVLGRRRHLTVGYAAEQDLGEDVTEILNGHLRMALASPELDVHWDHVPTDTLALADAAEDTTYLAEAAVGLRRYDGLRMAVIADTNQTAVDSTVARAVRLGVARDRIRIHHDEDGGLRVAAYPGDE